MATRDFYKPFSYPRAFEYYNEQQKMHWLPEEVPLHTDVSDWNHKLSSNEKNLLTQIFRFFTQGDVDVGKAYFDKYVPVFQLPELRMMMGAFANMESVHQHAYSLLLDTVGMPEAEYQAFHLLKGMEC
jgi:ribonucleoside-diphosphate reductase beta chain